MCFLIVVHIRFRIGSPHIWQFSFPSIDGGTGAPSSFPRGSQVRITASFPSQIKLFPIPNMAASITQRAIKLEEKSKYCLKRTSAASQLTRFMAKFDPQSSFLDTRCHKYNKAPAFWPGAVIIDRNSSVFPPPIIDKKWFNQYSSNIRSIFLQHLCHISLKVPLNIFPTLNLCHGDAAYIKTIWDRPTDSRRIFQ